jgi:hypothetical protein
MRDSAIIESSLDAELMALPKRHLFAPGLTHAKRSMQPRTVSEYLTRLTSLRAA